MNKSELIDTTTNAMAGGDSMQLTGFVSFVVRNRAARTGCNPKTEM
ncbi:DNA-binding protein HU-beta [uncultured Gammaproteobacteria bacterium]|nr:HU family DNA-binding protein [Bathymodiolus heckerae thiotrophic gill symbiont]CAC9538518.1 DNA-binding protein HU-beta [uncultured Gammaproteobacteria bacterium]CAC9952386.1 DNA-binding protein HU-beta [uncultured Gammaproteobacteria bacterium]CAC9965515.1 DNA-binding protein HU-beta [uncultured Gammaproteobacteria bacterium]SHN90245.1 DNA-binding protein HU-beta [Bathymodiolus heckerae thiotrophic gill symbiont]